MKANDQIATEYIQELEADNDNMRFDLHAAEEEIKALNLELELMRIELRRMFDDRNYSLAM